MKQRLVLCTNPSLCIHACDMHSCTCSVYILMPPIQLLAQLLIMKCQTNMYTWDIDLWMCDQLCPMCVYIYIRVCMSRFYDIEKCENSFVKLKSCIHACFGRSIKNRFSSVWWSVMFFMYVCICEHIFPGFMTLKNVWTSS